MSDLPDFWEVTLQDALCAAARRAGRDPWEGVNEGWVAYQHALRLGRGAGWVVARVKARLAQMGRAGLTEPPQDDIREGYGDDPSLIVEAIQEVGRLVEADPAALARAWLVAEVEAMDTGHLAGKRKVTRRRAQQIKRAALARLASGAQLDLGLEASHG
ncbi:MAG: hypothetical protein AB1697_04955 [Pseudomonadota bacterium]